MIYGVTYDSLLTIGNMKGEALRALLGVIHFDCDDFCKKPQETEW